MNFHFQKICFINKAYIGVITSVMFFRTADDTGATAAAVNGLVANTVPMAAKHKVLDID
jgi:hypothetical protein